MVVQHNLTAMNANRMLGITTGQQAKSSEKLSSGYRINRAADDAAGLSISEKMRKQINGLERASTNAQDGVSSVQTAEGALTEVHSMLQRMNELAVQAANGTNSLDDREAIQAEMQQLTTEIDRVAETTKFNETYLLKGGEGTKQVYMVGHDAGLAGKLVDGERVATFTMEKPEFGSEITIGGVTYKIAATVAEAKAVIGEADTAAATADQTITINGETFTRTAGADKWKDSANIDRETGYLEDMIDANSTVSYKGNSFEVIEDAGVADHVDDADVHTIDATKALELVKKELLNANKLGVDDATAVTFDTATTTAAAAAATTPTWVFEIQKGSATVPNALSFNLHVGTEADTSNKIRVDIETMSAAGLGIQNLNVVDNSGMNATYAIDAIADAIAKVSEQRSALGAIQNRLEHTIANLDNVVENTTAAESRIRDTDMAEEMVEYSKNNILAQAGQSMLAQANQSTQGVLSLLQ